MKVVPYKARLTSENVLDILKDYDVIVDGVDNFPTRYLLNDAALKLGKPVVHASIYRFEGQLTCFVPDEGPCYRCLYPEPPPPDMAPSCQEAGVLGVLPGVVGVLQATEAIKLALGIGKSLAGRLLMYDALGTKFREMKLRKDPSLPHLRRGRRPQPDPAHRLRAVLRGALTASGRCGSLSAVRTDGARPAAGCPGGAWAACGRRGAAVHPGLADLRYGAAL